VNIYSTPTTQDPTIIRELYGLTEEEIRIVEESGNK
jgi:hypothetical protein